MSPVQLDGWCSRDQLSLIHDCREIVDEGSAEKSACPLRSFRALLRLVLRCATLLCRLLLSLSPDASR